VFRHNFFVLPGRAEGGARYSPGSQERVLKRVANWMSERVFDGAHERLLRVVEPRAEQAIRGSQ
jgi:hypothetical protein